MSNSCSPLATLCDGVLQDATSFAGELDDDLCFIAVEMARMGVHYEVGRDDVTGLYDASFLRESMEREVSRAERKGYQVGVIALDLLGLETFSTQHGQTATDELLREFGALLHRCTRRSDIACRVRPDGFTWCCPKPLLPAPNAKPRRFRNGQVRRDALILKTASYHWP